MVSTVAAYCWRAATVGYAASCGYAHDAAYAQVETMRRYRSDRTRQALGDSVITGPRLTNVNDFRAIFIDAPSPE